MNNPFGRDMIALVLRLVIVRLSGLGGWGDVQYVIDISVSMMLLIKQVILI